MQPDSQRLLGEALSVAAPRAPLTRIRRRARELAARERTGRCAIGIIAGAVLMSAILVAFSGHSLSAGSAHTPLAAATAGAPVPAPLPTIS